MELAIKRNTIGRSGHSNELSYRDFSKMNNLSIKHVIAYLTNLKKDHVISDAQLTDLLYIMVSNYIANEVETRVVDMVTEKVYDYLLK